MKLPPVKKTVERFIPEIIEFLITFLVISISIIFYQTDASTNIILGIIGLSTTVLTLVIRQTTRSQTEEISDQLDIYRLLNSIVWPDLREQGIATIEECKDKLMQLAEGIDIDLSGWKSEEDDLVTAANRIRQARKTSKINGNMLIDINNQQVLYNETPTTFEHGVLDALRKKVIVERIEVGRRLDLKEVPEERIRAFANYLKITGDKGERIYVVWIEDLDPQMMIQPAFVICDDEEVQFFVNPQANVRKYRQVTVTRNPKFVKEYVERFETWKQLARPLSEVPEFQPYLQGGVSTAKDKKEV